MVLLKHLLSTVGSDGPANWPKRLRRPCPGPSLGKLSCYKSQSQRSHSPRSKSELRNTLRDLKSTINITWNIYGQPCGYAIYCSVRKTLSVPVLEPSGLSQGTAKAAFMVSSYSPSLFEMFSGKITFIISWKLCICLLLCIVTLTHNHGINSRDSPAPCNHPFLP